MATGWLVALGLFALYMTAIVWMLRTGRMQKWNLSLLLGIILMVRTQRGKRLLDIVARPKRFWNAFGDAGTVVTLAGMVLMTVLMLALIPVVLRRDSGIEPLGASEILVIPGVNPFVPLWYGVIALIITLVVHEGGHGVLARANNLRVKSLGLLFAVVPVGAFVEPDEDELKVAPRRHRLRVFAAGAFVNLVVAAIVIGGFSAMADGLEPIEGVPLQTVLVGSPAHEAGLGPRDILVSGHTLSGGNATMAPTPYATWTDFQSFMERQRPGNEVVFALHDGGSHVATLGSAWEHQLDNDLRDAVTRGTERGQAFCQQQYGNTTTADCIDRLQKDAYLGVSPFPAERVQEILAHPLQGKGVPGIPGNLLVHLSLPISEVRGFPVLSALDDYYTTPWDDSAVEGLYIPLAVLLFWVFWINLMVGLTNILPMLPLDGGHIFRDAAGAIVQRVRPRMDPERRDQVVGSMAVGLSFIILGAFLLQILGPRFV